MLLKNAIIVVSPRLLKNATTTLFQRTNVLLKSRKYLLKSRGSLTRLLKDATSHLLINLNQVRLLKIEISIL